MKNKPIKEKKRKIKPLSFTLMPKKMCCIAVDIKQLIDTAYLMEREAIAHHEHGMGMTCDSEIQTRNDLLEKASILIEMIRYNIEKAMLNHDHPLK